jgi:uncharacterized protein (TIGR04255 family)
VAGVYFETPLADFRIPHTGLYWHRVRSEFPLAQHAGPVAPGSELRWVDEITGLPMPRIWLLSNDKTHVIQLQGDCFFFNWRKQDAAAQYPRYRTIIAGFEKHRDIFLDFLRETGFAEPKPMLCELTYVNHIPHGAGWKKIDDLGSIFKDFRWSKEKEIFPTPRSLSWSCSIDLPDNCGTLTARMSQVTRVGDPVQSLRLDLSCKGVGKAKTMRDTRPWFELAHEWIVRGFADITTPEAQKRLWEREDV